MNPPISKSYFRASCLLSQSSRSSMEQLSASMAASRPIFGRLTQYELYQEPKKFRMKELFAVRGLTHPYSVIRHPSFSIATDLMWSDPDEIENWAVSPRGAGWLFGGSVVKEAGSFHHPFSLSFLNCVSVQPRKLPEPDCSCSPAGARRV